MLCVAIQPDGPELAAVKVVIRLLAEGAAKMRGTGPIGHATAGNPTCGALTARRDF